MYHVSLQALLAFDRICRLGTQKAAAEALAISPTAVSHAVKGLEARLKVKLLEKDGRASRPTAVGRRLASRLANGFDEIDLGLGELLKQRDEVFISVTPGFASLWLAPRMARASSGGAGVPAFRFEASTAPEDVDRVDGPDLAIRYSSSCRGQLLVRDRFVALYNPRLNGELSELTGQVLIDVAWEQPDGGNPRWSSWFEAAGIDTPEKCKVITYTNEHAAIQAALAGAGVVLASEVLAEDMRNLGLLQTYEPAISLTGPSYWLVKSSSKTLSLPAERFATWITNELSQE